MVPVEEEPPHGAVHLHGAELLLGVANLPEAHHLGVELLPGTVKVQVPLLLGVVTVPGVTNPVGAEHRLGPQVVTLTVLLQLGEVVGTNLPTVVPRPGVATRTTAEERPHGVITVTLKATALHGVETRKTAIDPHGTNSRITAVEAVGVLTNLYVCNCLIKPVKLFLMYILVYSTQAATIYRITISFISS